MNNNKSHKEFFANAAFGMGVACLGGALYFAPTLFTTEKSLVPISGKVENVKAFYTQVSSKGNKSLKSELLLTLENDNKNYKLVKNIGNERSNDKYELIEKELKKSREAIVWIKASTQSDLEPEVFQIANGEKIILYDMDDVKSELKYLFPFLLIIGFFGIGVFLHHKNPNGFKNLTGKKPAHNKT